MVLGDVAAAGTGFVVTVLPLVLLHLAAHRFAPGDYLQRSAVIGFDWRLLPIRWVLLVVDSRPLTAESVGMAARIFWFAPGLAGLLYACITPSAGRSAWRLLAASLLSNLTVYLCYRDLEPGGLWRYHQVHYFKFIFPFLLLASVFLAVALVRANNRLRAVLCLAAVLPLFLLRAEFHPQEGVALEPTANGTALPLGFPTVWDAAMLPLSGAWWPIYRGERNLLPDHSSSQTSRISNSFQKMVAHYCYHYGHSPHRDCVSFPERTRRSHQTHRQFMALFGLFRAYRVSCAPPVGRGSALATH